MIDVPRGKKRPVTVEIRHAVAGLFVICATVGHLSAAEETGYFPESFPNILNRGYSKILELMKEPSLFEHKTDRQSVAYRFLWLRGDHNAIAVRIEKNSAAIKGHVVRLSGASGYNPGRPNEERDFIVSPDEWEKLNKKVSATQFWEMPLINNPDGFGGSEWILEGVADGQYHVVDCWTPLQETAKRHLQAYVECCRFFLKLAEISVPENEFY